MAVSTHYFCAICLCRLFNRNTKRAGLALVRAGTLDDSDRIVPGLHIWTSRKQPWIILGEEIPAFYENAPVEAFIALLSA